VVATVGKSGFGGMLAVAACGAGRDVVTPLITRAVPPGLSENVVPLYIICEPGSTV
jgi:hypothetical protein